MQISGNTIIITGGGSGIGRALAHRLHDLDNQIIVAGQRQAALDETAAGRDNISTLTLDMDDPSSIAGSPSRSSPSTLRPTSSSITPGSCALKRPAAGAT